MRLLLKLLVLTTALFFSFENYLYANEFYRHQFSTADGQDISLQSKKGKVVLIVNIATRCGFTGQLDDLEKLYQKYKDKGLEIIAVPSNDFAGQTPEGDEEVATFCRLEYGVSFPITTRTIVKGENRHPLFNYLLDENEEISWNFEKFLIDKSGNLVRRFNSRILPLSKEITSSIEKLI